MENLRKISMILTILLMSVFLLTGCDKGEKTEVSGDKQLVKIVYPNWVEGIAMTKLSKVILEEKMNYEVEATMADVGVIFTSLAEGESDFLLDAWLPVLHKNYMEKYKDELIDLGANYVNATVGIAVPKYVKANSIDELQNYKDDFNGEIVGIDAGANIMNTTEEAIKEYGLDYELVRGSEPVMTAALGDAIESKEAIAVIGWEPHWKFARWDLKFLEDPKNIYGDAESVHTIARADIKEDLPEVAEYFENFKFTKEEISDLILSLEGEKDKLEASREWIKNNEELVDSWIPKTK